ncbi:MAG: amidohydrolase family protein [Kiloniellaceae bacterium]
MLDTAAGELVPDRHVLVAGDRIREVAERPLAAGEAAVVDLRGRVLMPGLCDGHVHVTAATANLAALRHWSPFYLSARASAILRAMLMRGFTTVRDAGGADFGLAEAVAEDLIVGPRILFCGKALSQTGGHGDMRPRGENALDDCFCFAGLGRVCDGVAEVRRAARDEIRRGATHLKLMVSGGVASPTDRIGNTQFAVEEIAAAVEEAEAAEIYVMAHAYTARAVARAVAQGVRSIEHGNMIDEPTADLMVEKGAYLVPTLSTYAALSREGLEAGMPPDQHAKLGVVIEAGMRGLELAHRRGVKLVYGTDLLGDLHRHQSGEFSIRAEVQKPAEIIRSATVTAAECFRMAGEIGVVAPGARADLLVVDGNPLDDLGRLQDQGRHLLAIMKDGKFYKNELN